MTLTARIRVFPAVPGTKVTVTLTDIKMAEVKKVVGAFIARRRPASPSAEDRFHIVAVGIEHEGGVVARRVTLGSVANTGRAIVGAACP